jgi:hypothetical protein
MSAVGRLVNTFVEPKAAFADIAARPSWWLPTALLTVLMLVYMLAFSSHVGWEGFMRQQIENNPRTQNLTADQREQALAMQLKYGAPIGTAMPVIAMPVVILVVAGVMMFVFSILLGGQVRYRQALGVSAHAYLPSIVGVAAAFLVMFVKDPSDFDLQNPAGFNIGFYLDPKSTPAWLVSLGNSIDVFSFWTILLLATGMAAVTRKSWKTSLMGVLMPWALVVLIKVGWAAFRG